MSLGVVCEDQVIPSYLSHGGDDGKDEGGVRGRYSHRFRGGECDLDIVTSKCWPRPPRQLAMTHPALPYAD